MQGILFLLLLYPRNVTFYDIFGFVSFFYFKSNDDGCFLISKPFDQLEFCARSKKILTWSKNSIRSLSLPFLQAAKADRNPRSTVGFDVYLRSRIFFKTLICVSWQYYLSDQSGGNAWWQCLQYFLTNQEPTSDDKINFLTH